MSFTFAITGHRPDKLLGYSDEAFVFLTQFAEFIFQKHQPQKIISGMALGADQIFAQAAANLKIPFIAAVPFDGQEKVWPEKSKKKYLELLEKAEEIVVVSSGGYAAYKMYVRNKWMVDRCDILLALWNGTKGGTGNCVDYAESVEKTMINVWNEYLIYNNNKKEKQIIP